MSRTQLLAAAACAAIASLPLPAAGSAYTSLYVLGDSLSDQGNLLTATTQLQTLFPNAPPQPSLDHYFHGRFSNGEVYAGYLAQRLGVSIGPSLQGGTNFAFGGARTDYNTVEAPPFGTQVYPHNAYPWSLNGERAAFMARGPADPHGLYVVFSGSNDILDILARGFDPATTIANTIGGIISVIDTFKQAGAGTVLVPNLPDFGLIPRVTELENRFPGISAEAAQLAQRYNSALDTALDAETGIKIIRFDTFDLLKDIISDPAAYGFINATQPCYSGFVISQPTDTVCSDPNDYVFWDVEHPSTHFHALLAEQLFVTATPEPSTLALYGAAVATLIAARSIRRLR